MTQRDLFYKWLFYSLVGLFWVFLQQMVLNRLDIWNGVHPFVLPLLPTIAATLERRQESAFFAIGAGLFCDLLMPGVFPCFYTLAFLSSALLAGLIAGRVIMPGFLCAFVCSVLALVLTDLLLMLFLNISTDFSAAVALSLMGQELLLTLPFSPLVFLTLRKVWRLIRNA
ncbi:MAG: hypothetical protein E7469_05480 [Ruminococcaceae bacterium]|nr:hypothetical protein [Oscillospiraceae bacterium]